MLYYFVFKKKQLKTRPKKTNKVMSYKILFYNSLKLFVKNLRLTPGLIFQRQ